jgi:hypothetical protein
MQRTGTGGAVSAADNTAAPTRTDAGKGAPYRRPAPQLRPDRSLSGYLRDPKSLNPALKQAARLTLVAARLPTSGARILPGFLIVGAQRCGTTSLSRTLGEHPAVFGAVLHEEVHFFDVSYRRGLSGYRSHYPLLAMARRAARASGATPISFESSPYYMFHPLAAERIARDLPGVRLLVLLRDPVERAYSAHANHVGHGLESESFERALELEESRLAGEAERIVADPSYNSYSHRHHSYRSRGHYIDQLEQLERIFGRERILVIDSDDFFADPGPAYDEVLGFLRLPSSTPAFTPQNARPRAPMPDHVRDELQEHYRPYDERLTAWLGHEPSWRR